MAFVKVSLGFGQESSTFLEGSSVLEDKKSNFLKVLLLQCNTNLRSNQNQPQLLIVTKYMYFLESNQLPLNPGDS